MPEPYGVTSVGVGHCSVFLSEMFFNKKLLKSKYSLYILTFQSTYTGIFNNTPTYVYPLKQFILLQVSNHTVLSHKHATTNRYWYYINKRIFLSSRNVKNCKPLSVLFVFNTWPQYSYKTVQSIIGYGIHVL
jgi:hypothetical protein